MTDEITRKIAALPRGTDGLIIQPTHDGSEYQRDEQHRRDFAANHFKYADPYTGIGRTFDPQGRYNCGRCNQAKDSKCLLLDIEKIDRKQGSCGDWENLCAGDIEFPTHYKSPKVAGYDIAVVGWGCNNCPYGERAYRPDTQGRSVFCGKFGTRVFWNACCVINGAKTVPIGDNGLPKQVAPIPVHNLLKAQGRDKKS